MEEIRMETPVVLTDAEIEAVAGGVRRQNVNDNDLRARRHSVAAIVAINGNVDIDL
ncbi:MAG TPA: hypothetical protein VE684_09990 [Crenalkalicoccus sp.]|jgi:hypothetical protein|nr:hypothetical protein [Crenalkalicoccus sp.]